MENAKTTIKYVFTVFIYLFIYQKHNGMSNLRTVHNTHVNTEKTEVAPSFNKNHAMKTYGGLMV